MNTPKIRTIKLDSYSDSQTFYIDADKDTIAKILLFVSNLNNPNTLKNNICQSNN